MKTKKFLLVVEHKFTNEIKNYYFETYEELKESKKEYKKVGNKILHEFKIEEIEKGD